MPNHLMLNDGHMFVFNHAGMILLRPTVLYSGASWRAAVLALRSAHSRSECIYVAIQWETLLFTHSRCRYSAAFESAFNYRLEEKLNTHTHTFIINTKHVRKRKSCAQAHVFSRKFERVPACADISHFNDVREIISRLF